MGKRPSASLNDLARAAGTTAHTLARILDEGQDDRVVNRRTAARIMALTPESVDLTLRPTDERENLVRQMRSRGWTLDDIANASDVRRESLRVKVNGVRPSTLARLRYANEVLLAGEKKAGRSNRYFIDGTVARRQVESLCVMGWSFSEIAARAGIGPNVLRSVVQGEPITARTAHAVAHTHQALRFKEGPSKRAVTMAHRRGYVPWLAWEDHEVSDPDAKPDISSLSDPEHRQAVARRYHIADGETGGAAA